MKTNLNSIVFSIAIVISASLVSYSFLNRNKADGSISVTGLGKADFTSDLIVWEGSYSKDNYSLKQAYLDLEKDKDIIREYLLSKDIAEEEMVFTSVRSRMNTKNIYSNQGEYIGEEFTGYTLNQDVQINSKNVETVEKVSREITELLNKGITLYSGSPRYYYTKLEDLKIEMISKATENARLRAEKIAQNSGSELADLISGKMGIFQITGQHSNESYSWGGAFNTSSKEKTASITMKLAYKVK